MSILATILEDARVRAARLDARRVRARAEEQVPPPSFMGALAASGLGVIAEVKRRSPSRGALDLALDPALQARRYAAGGAAAISVLTEPNHFGGSNADLEAVAAATGRPILRKDFTVDVAQVWEARALGAAAILLIVAALSPAEIKRFLAAAEAADLDAIVETHSPEEARVAIDCGATIIGVNNRDLATFEVDLTVAERMAPMLVDCEIKVAESGIWTAADAERMRAAGYDAVLVGEALVRASDPGALIAEFSGR